MNIFVARLNFSTTSEELQALFEQFGSVDSAKVIMDRETGKSKGFGFVEMSDDNEALSAIESLNESDFQERTIVVKKARPREDRNSGGGYNKRGGGNYNRGGGGGYNRGGGGGYNKGGGGYNKGGGNNW
jgi:cold-inducible RNA-binding protein